MLIAQRSLLQSELDSLRAAISVVSEPKNQEIAQQTTNELEQRVNVTSKKRNEAMEAAVNARNRCMQKQANDGEYEEGEEDPCTQFQEAANNIENTTMENARATAYYFSAAFLLKSNQQYQTFMQSRITALEREISEINTQLNHLQVDQVYLGEIATSINGLKEKKQQNFNQWTKFNYNSETSHMRFTETSFGFSKSMKGSAEIIGLGRADISLSFGFELTEMRKAFSSAKLQASGELLRVFIKRPWFKPTLFDNPILNFVSWELMCTLTINLNKRMQKGILRREERHEGREREREKESREYYTALTRGIWGYALPRKFEINNV